MTVVRGASTVARLEERTDYGTDLLSSTLLYSTNNPPVKSPHSHTSQTRNQTRKQGDGGGQGQRSFSSSAERSPTLVLVATPMILRSVHGTDRHSF